MTYFYRAYNFFKALLVASGKGFDRLRHHAEDFFLGSREGRRVDTI